MTTTTQTAASLARAVLAIDDLDTWLTHASPLGQAIYTAGREDKTGEGAAWLQRCIQANDTRSLRIAARTLAA
jgi:hypothetical protein